MTTKLNILGDTYGRLLVLSEIEADTSRQYLCLCSCGNLCVPRQNDLRTGNTTSCGCYWDEVRSTPPVHIGKDNSRWKGGVSTANDIARSRIELKRWKLKVLSRDAFICQKCGKSKSGDMRVHHILSFSRYPEAREEIDNGATLCSECHKKFHSLYSYKGFTDDNYWEWISEQS